MNTNNYVPPCMSKKEEKLVEIEEEGVRIKSEKKVNPILSFKGHLINTQILSNMELAGIKSPTLVQKYVIPLGLHGKDLLISAPTGMGKTISFLVPTLNYLLHSCSFTRDARGRGKHYSQSSTEFKKTAKIAIPIKALVLTPTRELAFQIHTEGKLLAEKLPINIAYAYGGPENKSEQMFTIRKGVDLLIATPGRVYEFAQKKIVDLANVSVLIFDEADRMLDMGFEKQIRDIISHLNPAIERQTMMFSATFPDLVRKLAREFFQKTPYEVHVGDGPLENIKQEIIHMSGHDANKEKRSEKLMEILLEYGYAPGKPIEKADQRVCSRQSPSMKMQWIRKDSKKVPEPVAKPKPKAQEQQKPKIVIFVDQKIECKHLELFLYLKGIQCASIHGDKTQTEREDALNEFKVSVSPILIATSVAARGLDIPGIALVINYMMSSDIKEYIHRIGRTGRAGKSGRAITFISKDDYAQVPALIEILKNAKQAVPAFLEEIAKMKGKGGIGGKQYGGRSQNMQSKRREREDTGQHFQTIQEIRHKEAPALKGKIEIKTNLRWDQEIS